MSGRGLRSEYVDTSAGRLHYRESGRGDPLVLLHPTPYSSRYYVDLMPRLKGLHVLAPDLPGCGESLPSAGPLNLDSLAGSVVGFLDALGIARTHLLGIHGGNKVAAALAARHPDRVDRLVFAGMTHSILLDPHERNAAMLSAAGRTSSAANNDDAWDRLVGTIEKVLHRTDATTREADWQRRVSDEVLDRIQSRTSVDAVYRANLAFDLAGALSRISAPTLVVELVVDGEAHLERQASRIAGLMKDAETLTLEGTDRDLVHGSPERIADPVLAFLTRDRRSSQTRTAEHTRSGS